MERQQEEVIRDQNEKDHRKKKSAVWLVRWPVQCDSGQKPEKYLVVTYFQSVTTW